MTRFDRGSPALLLAALFALQSSACFAEGTRIGVASSIKPNADGVMSGNSQTLSPGSELYANETIRTGNLGQADLVFVDKTNLTVGPTSEVLLDKFVYDPAGPHGKVVLQMTRGAFRFVTGTQDHRAYSVNTPSGSLGVRGTVVEVVVQEKTKGRPRRPDECATKVRLVEGAGASFTTEAGKTARLTDPNQVVCVSEIGAISYSTSSTSILGFQLAQQSPPPSSPPTPPGTTPPTTPPIVPCVSPNTPAGCQ